MARRAAALGAALLCLAAIAGCRRVPFNERERLSDRIVSFDGDPLGDEMRGHIESPREGALGGFSAVGAGGCGCN